MKFLNMYICNVKPHTKIYFKYFNIALDEVVSCEVCGKRAVDIHHIEARGMVGLLVNAIQELKAENDTLKEILQRNNIQ